MKPIVMPFQVKEAKKGRLKILNKTTIETAKTLGVVKITKKEGMTWSSQKHQMAESSQMTY